MSELYIMCGTVGTGKTTYAKKLEQEGKAVLFSADEWMIHFYGNNVPCEDFEQKLGQCKEMIYRTVEKLLDKGINTVLDFGFWKREERDYVRKRFSRHKINLVLLDCPRQNLKKRLEERNNNLPEYAYHITDEMYEIFLSKFEYPTEDENPTLVNS